MFVLSLRSSDRAGPHSEDSGTIDEQTSVNGSYTEGAGGMKTTLKLYKNVKHDVNGIHVRLFLYYIS